MTGKLYGVGVGPGDPDLITLKGLEILKNTDLLVVPKARQDKRSLAQEIVQGLLDKEIPILEIVFPMKKDEELLEESWLQGAAKVASEIEQGKNISFITIGDPLFYSTFGYLLRALSKDHPHIPVEVVPGVTAFNACASLLGVPLVEGDEKIVVLPNLKDEKELDLVWENFDTVILMKVSAYMETLLNWLKKSDSLGKARYISRCGQAQEIIIENLANLDLNNVDYMSLVIIKKGGWQQ